MNTVACVDAYAGGLSGPAGRDAASAPHPGLLWAGCTVLASTTDVLIELRPRVVLAADVAIWAMHASALTNRVYAEPGDELSRRTAQIVQNQRARDAGAPSTGSVLG